MDTSKTSTQIRAGIFLFIGIATICSLVLYFGRFSEWSENYYPLKVEYANANGLLKGAEVLLAGAHIGNVSIPPMVLPNMRGVSVGLRIDAKVKIPKKSAFSIGSSGLLGDRYVTVTIEDGAVMDDCITPGSVIQGFRESNISDLQQQVGEIIPKIDRVVSNISSITDHLNKDVLNKKGVMEMEESLSNIHAATAQIDSLLHQTATFLNKGNQAMDSAKGAADDMKAFLNNLRHHGIIFYRDTAQQSKP
jgi:phospholipid/cholesterol/gamma-HCH transport system substrate-binding protein